MIPEDILKESYKTSFSKPIEDDMDSKYYRKDKPVFHLNSDKRDYGKLSVNEKRNLFI